MAMALPLRSLPTVAVAPRATPSRASPSARATAVAPQQSVLRRGTSATSPIHAAARAVRPNSTRRRGLTTRAHAAPPSSSPSITSAPEGSKEADVLAALRNVIDPDFGEDIVNCGFIKDLRITDGGDVTFTLELTTPACPVKEEFNRLCKEFVGKLDWQGCHSTPGGCQMSYTGPYWLSSTEPCFDAQQLTRRKVPTQPDPSPPRRRRGPLYPVCL
jgi:metal-sulfur cluster biosynthetic enzyme